MKYLIAAILVIALAIILAVACSPGSAAEPAQQGTTLDIDVDRSKPRTKTLKPTTPKTSTRRKS